MTGYLHKKFRYTNSSEIYVFITKQEAYDAYVNGKTITIGYQDKEGGAFYIIKQFENELPMSATQKEKFEYAVECIKKCLPYKSIKYQLLCSHEEL